MILVDTSVWIDHFRSSDHRLADLLTRGLVQGHPHVLGELACGNLKNRQNILHLLAKLPQAPMALESEVLGFIDNNRLSGRGIGYIDAHLLASAALAGAKGLWTRDRRLGAVAKSLGLSWPRSPA